MRAAARWDARTSIKIDGSLDLVNVDVLGYIDHRITINIIKDGKIVEKKMQDAEKITNVIHCKNPRCITSIEQELPHIFYLADEEKRYTAASTAMRSIRCRFF